MATTPKLLLLLCLFALILSYVSSATSSNGSPKGTDDLDPEDFEFLEEDDEASVGQNLNEEQFDGEEHEGFGDFEGSESDHDHEHYSMPKVDERDVVVLREGNFSEFIGKNKFVLVEFYATWCGHCQALAPEYAAAATELKGMASLAKVDAIEDSDLAQKYEVQGFPTLYFFVDGVHKSYSGQRTKDAIVTWVKKKTGPGVSNLTTIKNAENVLETENKVVLAFLNHLVGPESDELTAASRLEDDVNFYQTTNEDIAKLFHLDPKTNRPALVLLKKEAEKLNVFDGQFTKSAIVDFVLANKLPPVITFTRENAPLIFENPIKTQIILFVTSKDYEKVLPIFQEAAKSFKGKLVFVHVDLDNEDDGKPIANYFGVTGENPQVIAFSGNTDEKKYRFDGEITGDKIKAFCDDLLGDKLKPFFKSDPIPETNDGDVKIVVGDNFDELVLDESKDVLLEIYAPWCGHCQALEPIYNKLGKHLRSIESLIIAKMDGTTNEHPRVKSDGYPTIIFFPAGNKSFDPITVDTERTVVAFYKFLKKHAAIPFKLQRPVTPTKPEAPAPAPVIEESSKDLKDEL
ncbi:protein disulfide isomerase-like 1-4 [Amborella trichopoda]|uniref:protein disulfide-isomerase n=1 Tax=Amborella trichopoda TaxID=13333 RepID=U5D3J4_AMBTC|nr:protein disulfide isomerase-like 1-4 [Amborella trichopoda]ERN15982.1 hypothetical protein AMTR_s00175p00064090 [Amborella trichopoda]|eukprot:XP_006854515.1 protein disulfide isomerase-like 1-4 [Amborella trichopoda]